MRPTLSVIVVTHRGSEPKDWKMTWEFAPLLPQCVCIYSSAGAMSWYLIRINGRPRRHLCRCHSRFECGSNRSTIPQIPPTQTKEAVLCSSIHRFVFYKIFTRR